MSKRQTRMGGVQKGQQIHAEGAHGEKTHRAIMEQLHAGPHEEPITVIKAKKRKESADHGKRRLVQARTQHDAAEKNSEQDRLHRDVVKRRV